MSNLNKTLDHILQVEGGFVNHPTDPGGATKYGVTQYTLNAYLDRTGADRYDVRFLHKSTAREIYKYMYWDPLGFDAIQSDTVATVIFDQLINQGVGRVPRRVQSVALSLRRNPGPVDGIMGPKTIQAVNSCSPYRFNREFLLHSQLYYAKIVRDKPQMSAFIVGWTRRVAHLWRLADQA